MNERYKVFYSIESSARPIVCKFDDEQKSILFASTHPGSVIRRESDNAILDMVSGSWIKIAQNT